ncbi:MAG: response regulator [Spirochaetia bacterium]|jgi:two-component system chemotaxis response regulator CheY|nr:response regulator [Spirochaetia bacterium]
MININAGGTYMNFLIVDDSAVMRRIHKNILLENKIDESQIFEAENGEVAVKIAENEDIGLFLLDWNMPKLDGLKFVQIIRSIDRYEDTPIIMITSEAAKYNVVDAISAGVTNYVVKPIKGDILWEKISRYIK